MEDDAGRLAFRFLLTMGMVRFVFGRVRVDTKFYDLSKRKSTIFRHGDFYGYGVA